MLTHSTVECLAVKIIQSESHCFFCDKVCKLIKAYCIIHSWEELLLNSVLELLSKSKKRDKKEKQFPKKQSSCFSVLLNVIK